MTPRGTGEVPLGRALLRAMRETGASAAMVYELAPDAPVLRLAALSGIPPPVLDPWKRIALAAPLPVAVAARRQRLVWAAGHQQLAREFPRTAVALPYDFALGAAPLTDGSGCLGAVVLVWPAGHPAELSGAERAAFDTACRRLAALLPTGGGPDGPLVVVPPPARAVGADEALAAMDYVERLPGGGCALDLEGRITMLSTGAAELLGVAAARMLGRRPWEVLPWLAGPVFEDRCRAAVISRRPVSFTAFRPPQQWLAFRLFPDGRGVSVWISADEEPDPVARRPAEAMPVRAAQMYHVLHLAAALTEAVGVQDVTDLFAEQIVPAFGAQGMLMYAAEAGRLRTIGQRGYPARAVEAYEGVPLTAANSPTVRALATGEPSFFTSAEETERHFPGLARLTGMAARAVLPLIVSGRPVGCCVLAYRHPRTFTPEERQVLTSLAGLMAQALDRAFLYDTKQQLAHDLQAGLLPHRLPPVPGLAVAARYLPSTRGMDIGGDFYDLIRLDEHQVAAVIGDVQGHNAAAAALMGQARTAVHAYASAGAAPGEVLARTNRLLADLGPDLFTSCLYVHLDLRSQLACLASAGHPPPVLRHPGGRTEVLRTPPGLLLGIAPDTRYAATTVVLPPGALLALYTDGLVERPGTDLDEGVAALAADLAGIPCADPGALADAVLSRRGTQAERLDDVALLLLAPDGAEEAAGEAAEAAGAPAEASDGPGGADAGGEAHAPARAEADRTDGAEGAGESGGDG
ncbi:SpoIIE family protein phosphatase [Streptomyces sp. RS10V-4]|uniref:SpoIIE family protein phosphatase n=1 Tax=Streptomyces rhizoryzae TaxID=2932493 RepID=UPI002003C241|nr:SpoIIE family protein phosphatase [Streptomyces rhizoryzae]MCK7622634.1 SpoIIE family protein phosphatase [Streptomyces rhizoryzae]